jgi:hypothetical protein
VAREKFRRRLGTVEGLRQRLRGDPAGSGAEEFSDEDIRKELHAAFDELFRDTRRKIAGIGRTLRGEERSALVREFRAEMRIARRARLLAFREAQRALKEKRIILRRSLPGPYRTEPIKLPRNIATPLAAN